MAKLYYRYGTMNSSKTANLLMVAYNYKSQGKRVLSLKPSIDTRWEAEKIISRVGIESSCILVSPTQDIYTFIFNNIGEKGEMLHAILVDEAQFLKKEQVKQLALVAEYLDVPVICYGLKSSYIDGELFEGSAALLYYADSIEEIKTICHYCNRKATMNLRVKDGKPIYTGEGAISLGDTVESEDYFIQTCKKHYYHPPIDKKEEIL